MRQLSSFPLFPPPSPHSLSVPFSHSSHPSLFRLLHFFLNIFHILSPQLSLTHLMLCPVLPSSFLSPHFYAPHIRSLSSFFPSCLPSSPFSTLLLILSSLFSLFQSSLFLPSFSSLPFSTFPVPSSYPLYTLFTPPPYFLGADLHKGCCAVCCACVSVCMCVCVYAYMYCIPACKYVCLYVLLRTFIHIYLIYITFPYTSHLTHIPRAPQEFREYANTVSITLLRHRSQTCPIQVPFMSRTCNLQARKEGHEIQGEREVLSSGSHVQGKCWNFCCC